jgi:hypothetical protein
MVDYGWESEKMGSRGSLVEINWISGFFNVNLLVLQAIVRNSARRPSILNKPETPGRFETNLTFLHRIPKKTSQQNQQFI